MSWYENLRRDIPYPKEYRGFNLWYDFNNGKHHDMIRPRTVFLEHWIKRFCKHEAFSRLFLLTVGLPVAAYLNGLNKRFKAPAPKEQSLYSGAQFVATIGRNHYGFETRATKSFEHVLGVLLGKEILGHILNQDSDIFRQDEIEDENEGLFGDFSEADILDLRKEPNHIPHVGIVYLRPEKHYLNAKPNDLLSPYVIEGEKLKKQHV